MKRPLVLIAALVALLAVVASACSADDQVALTVDGEEVLTVADLQAQLDELAEDEDFLTNSEGRGQGDGTLNAGFTAAVLSNHVLNALIAADLAAEGVPVSDDDVAAGTDLLAQQVGGDVEVIPALPPDPGRALRRLHRPQRRPRR